MSKIINKVKHELEEFAEKHAGYIPPSPSEINPYMPPESNPITPDSSPQQEEEEPTKVTVSDPITVDPVDQSVKGAPATPISDHNQDLHQSHVRLGKLIDKKNEIEHSIHSVTSTLDLMHKSLSDVIEDIEKESGHLTSIIKTHHHKNGH